MSQTLLVTGGAGYLGSKLCPRLLEAGYKVRVLDLYLFGEQSLKELRGHPHLKEFKGDIRDQALLKSVLKGCDAVIHLACLSNDASVDFNPVLGRSINLESFRPLVRLCKESGVRRFLFASSSSVYGLSDGADLGEDHPHRPITDYNRYKSLCEEVLWREKDADFIPVSVRQATICGYSPRMRLDLTVHIFTNQAINLNRITVFGGSQMRPNIHIEDVVDLYLLLLRLPEKKIAGQAFNAGFRNHRLLDLARMVREVVAERIPQEKEVEIVATPSEDARSYRISSEKLRRELGFSPRRTIQEAVEELVGAFQNGSIPNPLKDTRYYNVETVKKLC